MKSMKRLVGSSLSKFELTSIKYITCGAMPRSRKAHLRSFFPGTSPLFSLKLHFLMTQLLSSLYNLETAETDDISTWSLATGAEITIWDSFVGMTCFIQMYSDSEYIQMYSDSEYIGITLVSPTIS